MHVKFKGVVAGPFNTAGRKINVPSFINNSFCTLIIYKTPKMVVKRKEEGKRFTSKKKFWQKPISIFESARETEPDKLL